MVVDEDPLALFLPLGYHDRVGNTQPSLIRATFRDRHALESALLPAAPHGAGAGVFVMREVWVGSS